MKKNNVFRKLEKWWVGKEMNEMYPYATKWQVRKYYAKRATRQSVIVATFIVSVAWSYTGVFIYGQYKAPPQALAKEIVEVKVEVTKLPEILENIADCESGQRLPNGRAVKGSANHYDKNGKPKIIPNSNNTQDIGYMQINTVHLKDAVNRGYDIFKEEDNKAYGEYLLSKEGTDPWIYSKSCWKK